MTVTLAIVLGLIAHMLGDYTFQNHFIAVEKTKTSWVTLIHVTIYTSMFAILLGFSPWLILIGGTHFVIDRFRLAAYWIKFVNWRWNSTNHGFPEETPPWLSTWLLFIYDNIFHIVLNTLAIWLHFT